MDRTKLAARLPLSTTGIEVEVEVEVEEGIEPAAGK
jgi:hypothetical protein